MTGWSCSAWWTAGTADQAAGPIRSADATRSSIDIRLSLSTSLRGRGEDRAVTPLELFFDLVYVFAISQLSHHLFAHPDLRTGLETVILTLAVVYTWEMIAWLSNWLSPEYRSFQLLLLSLMLGSLFMSSGIEAAFGDRMWLFTCAYLAVQLLRNLFAIGVFAVGTPHHRHFVNAFVWEVVSG